MHVSRSAQATTARLKPAKLLVRRLLNAIARAVTGLVLKLDAEQLERIPLEGPIIIIVNHVNLLELPTIYSRIPSDLGTGFSKAENWDNPIYRLLFSNWDVIPIERDTIDTTALRRGLQALDEGRILFITPEGTRSHDGRLQEGKPGVVMMALRSGAPVWPIACYGGEAFKDNLQRLKRTEYHIAVGDPFRVKADDARVTGEVRRRITDEMMAQIASLLPPRYRGVYSDTDAATYEHLVFLTPPRDSTHRTKEV